MCVYPVAQGKLETEAMLARSGIPYTSVRPVYIYGPLNYNPVEEWFFHRLKAGRPIPVPGSGMQVRDGFGPQGRLRHAGEKIRRHAGPAGKADKLCMSLLYTLTMVDQACRRLAHVRSRAAEQLSKLHAADCVCEGFVAVHLLWSQVTQLGHVKDLATAFVKCMGNRKAYDQIYNISGKHMPAHTHTTLQTHTLHTHTLT